MGGERRKGDIQVFEILTASVPCSANMRHHSKFCADRSNRCRYLTVFRFFKMAAVCHLGFIKNGRHRGSPTGSLEKLVADGHI